MSANNVCPIRNGGQTTDEILETTEITNLNSKDRKDLLRLLMGQLPYVDRVALALRFWENCSIEEISNFLGMDWEETDRRLNRSFKVLRSALCEFSKNNKMKPLCKLNQDLGLNLKIA
jgi:DNA-directed RNA polymerase specialized sigma24 family protein